MSQALEPTVAVGWWVVACGIGLLMGPPDHVPSRRKLAAARTQAAAVGMPIDEADIVHSLYSLEAAQASAARLCSGCTAASV
jgi:DNA-binding LacI/PurR family transcriptional regulator